MERALQKLREAALPEGGWSWFPGGPRNEYMTLISLPASAASGTSGPTPRSTSRSRPSRTWIWMAERHARILKDSKTPEDHVPSATEALYLYGRSFFLKDLQRRRPRTSRRWTSTWPAPGLIG